MGASPLPAFLNAFKCKTAFAAHVCCIFPEHCFLLCRRLLATTLSFRVRCSLNVASFYHSIHTFFTCGIIWDMNNFSRNNRSQGSFQRRDFGRNNDRDRSERQMHQAVCSNCGKNCQVPFMPTGSRPVYCSDCFETNNGGSSRFEAPRDRVAPQPQNTRQLDLINEKLDKILTLLSVAPVKSSQKKAKIAKKKVSSKKKKA